MNSYNKYLGNNRSRTAFQRYRYINQRIFMTVTIFSIEQFLPFSSEKEEFFLFFFLTVNINKMNKSEEGMNKKNCDITAVS